MTNEVLKSEAEFLSQYNIHDYDIPLACVDMVIFAIIQHKLHVLLTRRNEHPSFGQWALPGGFIDVNQDKTLDDTAHRKLFEKTGIRSPYLEQVQTVGDVHRDPRGWSLTVLYFALIDYSDIMINQANGAKAEVQWLDIGEATQLQLAFDHSQLLLKAIARLKSKTRYTALPIGLMPELFTLTELQSIFEVILGHELDKKSFRRRVLDAGVLQPTECYKRSGKRDAQLYRVGDMAENFEFPRAL
ncbi:NUDIX hydrolase [Hydromonas duriensis]|uniref:ADP-ribose pyrophosphatase YjhB (NUDIX family) n=1 Tax=Hydromonas duriensis TaxID=1527608 RepID=A0A4R6YAW0_9BURK|nr:NUDIX domain-containing protein [Hydromonas duriensis]TDR32709.1 ADP-ribose pyrophosphatase YjhB (NUDIX family) [Hydromonas duriensis]